MVWNPDQYLRFCEERSLPFHHLVTTVDHLEPSLVVDLGCGTGHLTITLLDRWPAARLIGIDSSKEMIGRARAVADSERLRFEVGEILDWQAPEPADLILANACFHWIEDQRTLFGHLVPQLAEQGVLAFQVPANHSEPSHTLLWELCSNPRWRCRLDGLPATGAREPQWYIDELSTRGLEVTTWQTTYFHLLEGQDPVLEWVRGTVLRPVLERLPEDRQATFLNAYAALLKDAYPDRDGTTVFPFTRTFVVATKSQ
jgi:trans-aconitate 2-methyltransferase